MKTKFLWEILLPTTMIGDDGNLKTIRKKYHKIWDSKVREISNGLTILGTAKGHWISPDEELIIEKMIPVRLLCSEEEIIKIVDFSAMYYKQKAMMCYKISDYVIIKNFN